MFNKELPFPPVAAQTNAKRKDGASGRAKCDSTASNHTANLQENYYAEKIRSNKEHFAGSISRIITSAPVLYT